jgi:hypothetical protein
MRPSRRFDVSPREPTYLNSSSEPIGSCPASAGNGEERSSVKICGEDACEKNESTTVQKRRSPS